MAGGAGLDRFGTVKPFIDMLAAVIPWGCTAAGSPILAALRALPRLMAARKPGREHIKGFEDLVTGSWQRLVFGNPKLDPPLIDRPAYTFCILEALHAPLRRRDVYAVGADKWGNPRARLIEERLWVRERQAMLTSLGLDADPAMHLRELAELLDGAYREVAAGLPDNAAVSIKGGKLRLARLQAAPEPEGFTAVHDAVQAMLPRIDYPELMSGSIDGVGYLLKDRVAQVGDFLDALDRVGAGGTAFDPEVVRQLLARTSHTDPLAQLTARERQVLELMAQGLTNASIAQSLHVSQSAVEKHVNALFDKLALSHTTGYSRRVLAVLRYLGS